MADELEPFGYTPLDADGLTMHGYAVAEAKDLDTLQPGIVLRVDVDTDSDRAVLIAIRDLDMAEALAGHLTEFVRIARSRHFE